MPTFLILVMRTPSFNPDILPAHGEHLQRLREKGQLEMFGGFADKTGGAYVITASSLAEAEAIAAADPVVQSGSSVPTVKEWNLR